MFDMAQIGRRIAEGRKAKNLTQMELADRMGVSFQAVSNWERGNSMPDIAKLPTLARKLGLRLDDLLDDEHSGEIVEKLAEGSIAEVEVTAEDFENLAPIMKPEQTEKVFDQVQGEFDLRQIVALAPFLNREILMELIEALDEDCGNMEYVMELAPFLGKENVGRLAMRYADSGDMGALMALAPFLRKEDAGKLAMRYADSGDMGALVELAPFLDRGDVGKLAMKYAENGNMGELVALAPFLDREDVGKLAVRYAENGNMEDLVALAPFLEKEDVGKFAERYMDGGDMEALAALAPFLREEDVNRLALSCSDCGDAETLLTLAPFMKRDVLSDLVRRRLLNREKAPAQPVNDAEPEPEEAPLAPPAPVEEETDDLPEEPGEERKHDWAAERDERQKLRRLQRELKNGELDLKALWELFGGKR